MCAEAGNEVLPSARAAHHSSLLCEHTRWPANRAGRGCGRGAAKTLPPARSAVAATTASRVLNTLLPRNPAFARALGAPGRRSERADQDRAAVGGGDAERIDARSQLCGLGVDRETDQGRVVR